MLVAGIDYSSHAIDIVRISLDEGGVPLWDRFELKGQDAFDRARDVAQAVPGRHSVWWDTTLAVGIEHPAGRHGVGPLLRIQGAVLACIPARMLVQPWPPASWRKAVGLKGNALKENVKHYSIWSWLPPGGATGPIEVDDWPQDAHDAHLIAIATRTALHKETHAAA